MPFEQFSTISADLQNMTSLVLIVGSIAIMGMSIAVSGIGSGILRFAFLIATMSALFALYNEFQDINGDFFLNLATEILGTMIIIILLNDFIVQNRSTFPIVAVVVILMTLPIEAANETVQPILLNISTEVLGAFLVLILLQRRDWLWNKSHKKREYRIERAREKYKAKIETLKKEEKDALLNEVRNQLAQWKNQQDQCDIGMLLAGTSELDIKRKLRQLKQYMKIVAITEAYRAPDNSIIQCYAVCILKKNKIPINV